jgi:hypothetical protein
MKIEEIELNHEAEDITAVWGLDEIRYAILMVEIVISMGMSPKRSAGLERIWKLEELTLLEKLFLTSQYDSFVKSISGTSLMKVIGMMHLLSSEEVRQQFLEMTEDWKESIPDKYVAEKEKYERDPENYASGSPLDGLFNRFETPGKDGK